MSRSASGARAAQPGMLPALAIVLALALAFTLPGLGAGGLSRTEGHRVVPALEMIGSGDWIVPTLFEQPYLRKPPAVFWAIAASASQFGEHAFAYRLPSALASVGMAVLAFLFAARWFGPRWALAAGVSQTLAPFYWDTARAAEIEALHHLGVQAAVLLSIDMFVFKPAGACARRAMLLALSVALMLLAKGPAALPALLAVPLAVLVVRRTRSPEGLVRWLVPVVLGAVPFAVWVLLVRTRIDPSAVVAQSTGDFLWNPGRFYKIALLPFEAFVYALPLSLWLLFPFGPDAGRELVHVPRERDTARALAWSAVLALLAYTALGVSNVRYTMPAFVFLAPLASYVWRGMRTNFTPPRRLIARVFCLGHPLALGLVLAVAAGVFLARVEPGVRATSGERAGLVFAEHLDAADIVYADGVVEARPETPLAVRRAVPGLTVRWAPRRLHEAPDGAMLLLRTDGSDDERPSLLERGMKLTPIAEHDVHKYRFGLYRVTRVP